MAFVVLAVGVAFVIIAIAGLKLHPFLSLILAALIVGVFCPRPLTESNELKSTRERVRTELEARVAAGELAPEALDAELEAAMWKEQKRWLESDRLKKLSNTRRKELAAELEAGRLTAQEYETRLAQVPIELERQWEADYVEDRGQASLSVKLTMEAFGNTAGKIAIVIVLAAIIGQCLLESGAADMIIRWLLKLLGVAMAPIALLANGYILSVPVFFDTVFYLVVPLSRALRMRLGKGFVLFVLAPCAGGVITHSLVPPTPGPYVMVVDYFEPLGLDLGVAIGVGFLLGLIPAGVGLLFAMFCNRRFNIPFREVPGSSQEELEAIVNRPDNELPGIFASIFPVVLPVLLITGHTVLQTLRDSYGVDVSQSVLDTTSFLGHPGVALFLATAWAVVVLVRQKGLSLAELKDRLEPAVTSAGIIILITSAGGAFGKMLARTGISDALQPESGEQLSAVAVIFMAWGIAAVMKIAQGSGTVSMITTAGIMAAILGGDGVTAPCHMIYVFAAIGFGSLVISWMNDSGFWVVCKMSGFTERETLCTWTPMLALIGITGLIEVLILSFFFAGV